MQKTTVIIMNIVDGSEGKWPLDLDGEDNIKEGLKDIICGLD